MVKTTVDKIDYYERQHDFSVPTEEQVFSDEVYEFYRTAKANGFKTSDERIQAESDRMEQEACRLLDIKKNLGYDFIDAIAELQAKGVDYASVIKSIADVGNWNLICSECLKEFVGRFVDNYKSGPALIPEADEEPDA